MKSIPIYLFMDAMGWEIVQNYHFLESELPFRYPVQMQFGYSSTAIPTILTGKYPREHNHFSFYYYDPEHSPFKIFRYLKFFFGAGLHPHCLLNRGRVRGYISRFFAKWKGYTGYFQLYSVPYDKLPFFDYCEKEDIFAPRGLAPLENLHDILLKSGLRFQISNWRLSESENIDIAEKLLLQKKIDFAFIYTAEFDSFLHDHIFDQELIKERVETYASRIKRFLLNLHTAQINFRFHIISDHGMTPTKSTCNLMSKLKALPLIFGKDYASLFDSTMARFWYLTPKAKELIQSRLQQADCPGYFLSQEEKIRYGIDFKNNRFGDDIFLMDTGIQIEPCDLGAKALKGMHGYHPQDKDSYAAWLSTHQPYFIPTEVKDYFTLMKNNILQLQSEHSSRQK